MKLNSAQSHPPTPHQAKNDLFAITMGQLHQEAPPGLVESLKASLEQIRRKNPNSAQTAKSCLDGLAGGTGEEEGPCTLLKVLTAAYLINGGVMLKYQEDEIHSASNPTPATLETTLEKAQAKENLNLPKEYQTSEDLDLKFLEAELECFELESSPGITSETRRSPPSHPTKPADRDQKEDSRWQLHCSSLASHAVPWREDAS
jgi:hypothetical protein